MVAYTFYDVDNRVRRYAEALAKRGDLVDVMALRREGQSSEEVINGVRVFRIQRRVINERSKLTYLAKLFLFFAHSLVSLTREHIKNRYSLIHIHSVPDFEVFVAIFPKLTGTKVILDIHDIVPEFYASKFNVSQNSLIFRMLIGVERLSAAFSDHVIVANHIWQKRLQERSVKESKCTTILNFPDRPVFSRHGKTRKDSKFIILYPGTFNYHQGLDIAVRAFALLKDQVPLAEFHIYGKGDQLESLRSLISELGLENRVFLKSMLPYNQINAVIENADLGIVPKRNNVFGNEAFSSKILEFMALGVPVIVPDTMIDRHYFNDSVAEFFHANDERSLADAMLRMIKHPELRQELVRNADEFVKRYAWEENKASYLDLVDALVYSESGLTPPRELCSATSH
jgi:glycosyltransferase involved in cell wall biosynthesis